MEEVAKCQLCGEPMPPGEEMFNYHGYSGDCPKPPMPKPDPDERIASLEAALREKDAELDQAQRHRKEYKLTAEAALAELAQARTEIERLKDHSDGNCSICGEDTNSLAGNPSRFPLRLPFGGGNGKLRAYHLGCVVKAVAERDSLRSQLEAMSKPVSDEEWKTWRNRENNVCGPREATNAILAARARQAEAK